MNKIARKINKCYAQGEINLREAIFLLGLRAPADLRFTSSEVQQMLPSAKPHSVRAALHALSRHERSLVTYQTTYGQVYCVDPIYRYMVDL